MNDHDDLFSPEALRLLDESCDGSRLIIEPNGFSLDEQQPAIDRNRRARRSRNGRHWDAHIPGQSIIELPFCSRRNRRRAKFDKESRKKVAIVRKKGACMRCRILKIPVSYQTSVALTRADSIAVVFR